MKCLGIDLGIRKIAFGFVEDGVVTSTMAHEAATGIRPYELHVITNVLSDVLGEFRPDYIFIEIPVIGNNRKYSMQISETYGAVLAEIGAWQTVGAEPSVAIGVNNREWKKQLIGQMPKYSAEQKETVRRWLYDQDSAYAVLCDRDQDRVDAACIALYGHLIYERAEHLVDS